MKARDRGQRRQPGGEGLRGRAREDAMLVSFSVLTVL